MNNTMCLFVFVCFVLLLETYCHADPIPQKTPVTPAQNATIKDSVKMKTMIFPDELNQVTFKANRTKCKDKFCEAIDGYPDKHIAALLSRSNQFQNYFKEQDFIASRFPEAMEDEEEDGEQLCPTLKTVRFPKALMTKSNNELFIVNTDKYQQAVVIQTCSDAGKACKFGEYFPGYTTKCTQKYTIKRLIALKEDGNAGFDSFDIPSCCVCTILQTA